MLFPIEVSPRFRYVYITHRVLLTSGRVKRGHGGMQHVDMPAAAVERES